MSRYINAEYNLHDLYCYFDFSDEELTAISTVLKLIPTADVVDVVRCKDCRYWQDNQEGHYPNELCPWDKNETPDEDDYCSFGERKILPKP